MAIFSTRIVDFKADPDVIVVGDKTTIRGVLQWYCPWCIDPLHPFGQWMPLEGETVELYVDGIKVSETVTSGGGQFKFTRYFTEEGTYEVKARYPGSITHNENWSDIVVVKVLDKDEYDDYKQKELLMYALIATASFAAIAGFISLLKD